MSDFAVLAAIALLFVLGTFLFFYLANRTNDVGDQILNGVVDGVAVSVHHRMFRLYNYWLSYNGSVVSCMGFLAFVQIQLAGLAGDDGVRILGYLAALFAAAAGVGQLVLGASAFNHYRSVLREAEAD